MSYPSEVLADSPVLYYRLGGTPTPGIGALVDASGNGRTGDTTASGWTFGVAGAVTGDTAATLSGATAVYGSSGVDAPCNPGAGGFAVEAWVKTTGTGIMVFASKFTDANNLYFLGVNITAGKVSWQVGANTSPATVTGAVTVTDGAWHHVVGVRDVAANLLRLYVDGAADGIAAITGTAAITGSIFELGRLSTPNYYYGGSLDEVAYYPAALSAARVAAHYAAASGSPAAATAYAASLAAASGPCGQPVTVTLTPNGTSGVTVTPATTGGGTFSPTTVTFDGTSAAKTLTYTPASVGAKSLTFTNSGSLTNPGAASYTSLRYSRVDTTSPDGTAIMVLTPWDYSATAGANLCVYHHGAGETYTALLADSLKAGCVDQLLADGFVLIGSTAAGDNWGNAAGMTAMLSAYAWAVANRRVKQVVAWSQSMGGLTGLLCVADQRFPCVAWYGTYPVASLANMFGSNAGTYAGSIRAAYGVASDGSDYSTKTAGHDPLLLAAAAYPQIGYRFVASASDTVVSKSANSDAMSASLAARAREYAVVTHTGNHGDPSAFQPSDISAFYARCLSRKPATNPAAWTS